MRYLLLTAVALLSLCRAFNASADDILRVWILSRNYRMIRSLIIEAMTVGLGVNTLK